MKIFFIIPFILFINNLFSQDYIKDTIRNYDKEIILSIPNNYLSKKIINEEEGCFLIYTFSDESYLLLYYGTMTEFPYYEKISYEYIQYKDKYIYKGLKENKYFRFDKYLLENLYVIYECNKCSIERMNVILDSLIIIR